MKNAVLIIGFLITSSLSFAGQSENTKSKIATMQSSAKGEVKTVATPTVAVVNNNPNAADFKFENESHDFGVIPEGPQAKFDFEFTNTGKEALILTDVHASCGCTTPVWPKEPILPGTKSKITAVYNTKGRGGNFAKSITIKSNAKSGDKVITIKGSVEKAPTNVAPEKAPNIMMEMPK